jgi:hypothetical protein
MACIPPLDGNRAQTIAPFQRKAWGVSLESVASFTTPSTII